MEPVLQLLLGLLLAIVLHELTHVITLLYYKIPFKAIVFTKWTAFGFLIDNEKYVTDNKKMTVVHFSPLIWCLLGLVNPNEVFFLLFPLVNIFGGMGDFYGFFKLIRIPKEKRIEVANGLDEKILGTIIWKKELHRHKTEG